MRAQRRVGTICSHVAAQQHPSAAPARPAACAAAEATAPAAADPPPPPDTRRAVPVGSDGLLAQEHVDAYVRDGFLAVSGLIPPAVLGPAIDCMWRIMDRENRRSWRGPPLPARAQPLDRADPTTWTGAWQGMLTSPEILATFTPTYINVARQLAAANAAGGGVVALSKGVYEMEATSLGLADGVQLVGASDGPSVLQWGQPTSDPLFANSPATGTPTHPPGPTGSQSLEVSHFACDNGATWSFDNSSQQVRFNQ